MRGEYSRSQNERGSRSDGGEGLREGVGGWVEEEQIGHKTRKETNLIEARKEKSALQQGRRQQSIGKGTGGLILGEAYQTAH